jgi:Mrp family chromosome partitioning ATPase
MFPSVGRALRRRKRLILAAGLVGGLAPLFAGRPGGDAFRAEAWVRLPSPPPATPLSRLMPVRFAPAETPAVARRAAALLGWIRPETPEEDARRLAAALLAQVRAEWAGAPARLRVSAVDKNPARAAAMANAVAAAYVQSAAPRGAVELAAARKEMSAAQDALRQAEARMKAYLLRHGDGKSPVADELDALRSLLSGLRKIYTERHPEVAATRAKIEALEERIGKETARETSRQKVERDLRIAEENVAFLAQKRSEASMLSREESAQVEEPARPPERTEAGESARRLAGAAGWGLLAGLAAAVLLEAAVGRAASGAAADDKWAGVPLLASIPAARGGLFSFLSRPNSVEKLRRELIFLHPTESPLLESYRTLKANLRLPPRPGARPAPVLGVTSTQPSVRKDLTALNLCLMTARSGLRTLLVEGDLRRPLIHWLLGLPGEPGLADAAVGTVDWARAVRGTSDFIFGGLKLDSLLKTPGIENFRFLPAGRVTASPSDILGAPQLERVMRETRSQFDLVVLNCPPFGPNADVLQAAARTDAVALVHESSGADADVRRAKEQLDNIKARASGVVLCPPS